MVKIHLWFKSFLSDEDGLGTLEILLIVAVLIGVALLFRETITNWVSDLVTNIGDSVPLDVPNVGDNTGN